MRIFCWLLFITNAGSLWPRRHHLCGDHLTLCCVCTTQQHISYSGAFACTPSKQLLSTVLSKLSP